MKKWAFLLMSVAALVIAAHIVTAQDANTGTAPPEGGQRHRGGPGAGPGGGPGGEHRPPMGGMFAGIAVIRVLDADKDGELSAEEIANAATALKTLDKDGDGKISRDELRPPRPEGKGEGENTGEGKGGKRPPRGPRPGGPRPEGPGPGAPAAE